MKKAASALLVTASAVAAGAQAPQDLLASLHHRARPVLIFAGSDEARVHEQYTALQQHADASNERQMHVILLSATLSGIAGDTGKTGVATSVASPAEQEALRKRFHVAPNTFAVILVGKDGGEKLRSNKPISWETLQSTIDAMPMRQQEMRGKPQ